MSPEKKLFEDWLSAKRRYQNHDGAFSKSRFEQRFDVSDEGLEELARLSELAKKRDVFLVCQCHSGHKCHREFLLLLARKLYKAKAEKPKHDYPAFEKRIPEFRKRLRKRRATATNASPSRRKAPSRD